MTEVRDVKGDSRDDATLLAGVATGDAAALRELHDRHAPWLAARLRGRCGDPDLVQQAVQDTFVAVWRRPEGWRGEGPVAAWLWGIAIRRLLTHLGRRPGRQRASAVEVSPSAEERVLAGIEHGALGPALDALSPELQAVVQATVLDGLTTREASRLLGIPRGTVKTRLMRAKRQLREVLV
ncbi:MAG TPA: RNA polymerase sigma factor [Nitriliruptorales bacterium]